MAVQDVTRAKCYGCGFETRASSDEWNRVNHPPIGPVVQCPECGSTNVHSRD